MDEQETTNALKQTTPAVQPPRSLGVMLFFAVILCAALYWVYSSGLFGPLKDAKEALARQDYTGAINIVQPRAEEGNAGAQLMMGDIYLSGLGVAQSDETAMEWYRKAAEGGNMDATLLVAASDSDYLRKKTISALGTVSEFTRRGVTAVHGSAGEQRWLAEKYENGDGVDQDYMRAYYWLWRATAGRDYVRKSKELGKPWLERLGNQLLPDQLRTAKRIAAKWNYAAVPISIRMKEKKPFDLDKQLAFALEGREEAQFELGYRSETGEGMRQDYQEAYFWYNFGGKGIKSAAILRKEYVTTLLLTPEQIALTEHRIEEWKKSHSGR
jgi:uncharacterized protein